MSNPDELLVALSAMVEREQSNQMSLTVVVAGAVITGRLAPESLWRERVSEVLKDSDRLGPFSDVFTTDRTEPRPDPGGLPTHLHFHLARILQGTTGIPETGGMYRVAIDEVSAWTVGDFSYSDQ
ncbi:Gas vesicle protein OS=Streptomyces alboniger OX=132473 GN=CP975_22345 PE=4 SV=1 [Streptomyces alboniger]